MSFTKNLNKLLLIGTVLVGGSMSGNCSEESETSTKIMKNPINAIIKHYSTVSPENMIVSFNNSLSMLLEKLESPKYKDIYSRNIMLKNEWERGIDVLTKLKNFKFGSNDSVRVELYNQVQSLTDNGFFDVSNAVIDTNPTFYEPLRNLFNDFWHHLLQAKEITSWLLCSTPEAYIEDVPYLCFEARGLVKDLKVKKILWSISILGNVDSAIEELDEYEEPSEEQILKAKTQANKILKATLAESPNLAESLKFVVKR